MLSKLYSVKQKEDGFTLIELLVVVIIIGILAAIALPIFIDQQKVAVDASVKSDVRNTVTNVTNMQAQQSVSGFKLAQTRDNTVELRVNGDVVASANGTSSTNLSAPIALGTAYVVDGFNAGGKAYSGADKAYTFTSSTGQFSVTDVSVATSWSLGGTRAYTSTFEDGNREDTLFGINGQAVINSGGQAHSGVRSVVNHTNLVGGSNEASWVYKDMTAGKAYTFEGWYYLESANAQPANLSAVLQSYATGTLVNTPITGSDLTPNVWHKFSIKTTSAPQQFIPFTVSYSNTDAARLYLDDIKVIPN